MGGFCSENGSPLKKGKNKQPFKKQRFEMRDMPPETIDDLKVRYNSLSNLVKDDIYRNVEKKLIHHRPIDPKTKQPIQARNRDAIRNSFRTMAFSSKYERMAQKADLNDSYCLQELVQKIRSIADDLRLLKSGEEMYLELLESGAGEEEESSEEEEEESAGESKEESE
ncbi:hypothetical protein CCACVL1_22817 [Corchorus capsularis]|uniref:Uncharacterized protein n=1 Tax=Corchorus capsularis TaxID=210143 RepID=A0A1R3GWS8_COCAP|nr:hypothetical protein CCACVL1_22817 [Corchorus capsularis]